MDMSNCALDSTEICFFERLSPKNFIPNEFFLSPNPSIICTFQIMIEEYGFSS